MSICQDMHGYARIGPREHVLQKANIYIICGSKHQGFLCFLEVSLQPTLLW